MELNHANGYWVSQLTDENVKDLLAILTSKKKNKKFRNIIKQERTTEEISILYYSTVTNRYLTYKEDTLRINDFKISGGHSYIDFFEFMIELFGEEYANDFLLYIEQYIAEGHTDNWTKRFIKLKDAVPAIIDSFKHNTNNDI